MSDYNWDALVENADYAFQPIANPITGFTFAVEALLRPGKDSPFTKPSDFIDAAFNSGVLFGVDVLLRKKALKKFITIPFYRNLKFFYNYDPRLKMMDDYRQGVMEKLAGDYGLPGDSICLELSENHRFDRDLLARLLLLARERGFYVALDDFGSGYSGLELFYNTEPDFLKFDRFLISEIDRDVKKRAFCDHLIRLVHVHGALAIAEGIETEAELNICKDLGFDLVQGFFISRPLIETGMVKKTYREIHEIEKKNRRAKTDGMALVNREMSRLMTVSLSWNLADVIAMFRVEDAPSFFPVLDGSGYPVGVIHEKNLKQYLYTRYGLDLLAYRSLESHRLEFITRCPVADISTPGDQIIEMFVNDPGSLGVIVTENLRYAGFLESRALLNIINEMNIAYAREINPLSRLPGNMIISRKLAEIEAEHLLFHYLVYFDFNYFKPFNDRFGFRQGDRVILGFADILRKRLPGEFIGHIGGDDFFSCISRDGFDQEDVLRIVTGIINDFLDLTSSFFSYNERTKGSYTAADRSGILTDIPVLGVCAAIVVVNPGGGGRQDDFSERLHEMLTETKIKTKLNENRIEITDFFRDPVRLKV